MRRPAAPRRNTTDNHPLAYLLTFTTYGTWLHGDVRGSVDPGHAGFDAPRITPNPVRKAVMRAHMKGRAVTLDGRMRVVVESAIREACRHRGWALEAINVRTNHVHVVVGAPTKPEPLLTSLKAWATRRCREQGLIDGDQTLWTRHGSTRYLWTEPEIERATRYVVEGQGRELPGQRSTDRG